MAVAGDHVVKHAQTVTVRSNQYRAGQYIVTVKIPPSDVLHGDMSPDGTATMTWTPYAPYRYDLNATAGRASCTTSFSASAA